MMPTGDDVAALLRLTGQRVAVARTRAGLTVAELAERARMEAGDLADLEAGRYEVEVEELHRISDVLDVRPGSLVPEESELAAVEAEERQDPAGGRPAGS